MSISSNGGRLSITDERDLLQVGPLPAARYENEALAALAVYSVHWLRAWQLRPTLEAITVLNHRLFPERFSMVSFPEYPDAIRTLRSLLQGGPKYRGWLSGSNRAGYSITPSGKALVDELLRRIGYPPVGGASLGVPTEPPKAQNHPRKQRPRDVDHAAEVSKLRESRLFHLWSEGPLQEKDLIHMYSALGVFDHTPAAKKRLKLNDVKGSAKKTGDSDIEQFLADVEMAFPASFRDQPDNRNRQGGVRRTDAQT